MMKIAILTIATGKYQAFTRPLYKSIEKYFLLDHEVSIFLFSDIQGDYSDLGIPVLQIPATPLPWPLPTLLRFHTILGVESVLSQFDYLFYMDIDMRLTNPVGEEILGDITATKHSGFYAKARRYFTYETRRSSKAYIPWWRGTTYYAGGFLGGKTPNFIQAAKTIQGWINTDLARNIIARWHDESYWNRYLLENPPTTILSPSYCHPENKTLPFEKKILALDKNHSEFRNIT